MEENKKILLASRLIGDTTYNLVIFRQVEGEGAPRTYQLYLIRGPWEAENPEYVDYKTFNETNMMVTKYPDPRNYVMALVAQMNVKFKAAVGTTNPQPTGTWGDLLEQALLALSFKVAPDGTIEISA